MMAKGCSGCTLWKSGSNTPTYCHRTTNNTLKKKTEKKNPRQSQNWTSWTLGKMSPYWVRQEEGQSVLTQETVTHLPSHCCLSGMKYVLAEHLSSLPASCAELQNVE